MAKPGIATHSVFDRFAQLRADIAGASRAAGRSDEAQRAMTRSRYGLAIALAVVSAFIVQSALHGFR